MPLSELNSVTVIVVTYHYRYQLYCYNWQCTMQVRTWTERERGGDEMQLSLTTSEECAGY